MRRQYYEMKGLGIQDLATRWTEEQALAESLDRQGRAESKPV